MNNPFEQIQSSISAAQQDADRNAGLLFLATSSGDGQPSVRTLLLRKIVDRSLLILFSKYHGKWRDFQENEQFEVLLWYPSIGHQYRIRGSYHLAAQAELLTCWNEQPTPIKRVDMSYSQEFSPGASSGSVADFQSKVGALPTEQVESAPPPDHVVAAWLTATDIERMVEAPNRLHDRVQYVWRDESWHAEKVIP